MRIRSIDFLRGIAIILVLLRHIDYIPWAHQIGWSGVDLFFVLSGFLVSSLLFSEYKKYNTINAKQFLIRRAFKIYPLFWLVVLYTIITHHFTGFGTPISHLLAEMFFYQNYTDSILAVTWSLAVEEHFYILLIIGISIAVYFKKLQDSKAFHKFMFVVLAYCLVTRIVANIQHPQFSFYKHYSPTQNRIDGLAFGVIIAYNYYFNQTWLKQFVEKYAKFLAAYITLITITLFIFKVEGLYMRTIGFTLVYLAFGAMLALFILHQKVKDYVEQKIPEYLSSFVCTVGTYSYAIYLTHLTVIVTVKRITGRMLNMHTREITFFVCYITFSIIVGALLTYLIENPFLKIRDKYFPKKPKLMQTSKFSEALPI